MENSNPLVICTECDFIMEFPLGEKFMICPHCGVEVIDDNRLIMLF